MKGLLLKDRFYLKFTINNENGCWEWAANRFPKGYGCFKLNGKSQAAHRVSYEIHIGKIKKGMVICHHCDNPCCVNPAHLFMGTQKENLLDRKEKGRSIFGEKNGRSKLKTADINKIRLLLKNKIDQRDIAKEFGVGQTTISRIKMNESWNHIKGEVNVCL
jgi:hypothetical protein